MTALAGRCVVVTRARHQAASLAASLEARGARPVFFPTIAISAVRDRGQVDGAIQALPSFAWVVFTSANVVSHFWAAMQRANVAQLPPGVKVAAVGPATTAALAAIGIAVDAQPATYVGGAIAATMGAIQDLRVLVPKGDRARPETVLALRARGAAVSEVILYHTTHETPDPSALDRLRAGADAITFTSPSSVQGFSAILGPDARTVVSTTLLAVIGPTTASAIREMGWSEPLEAPAATSQSLVDCLEAHFEATLEARPT